MVKVSLYVLDSGKYFEGVAKLVKAAERKNIVYVTTNKPYNFVMNAFKKKGINTDKIFFIDCISSQAKEKATYAKNCVFINSPQNLTALSIAVSEAVKSIKGSKILFLDSLGVLLIYNDANTVGKFSNFLLSKMRMNDVDAVMLALESDAEKDVVKQIESVVDEVKKSGNRRSNNSILPDNGKCINRHEMKGIF